MEFEPGTYALILRCPRRFTVRVGQLGKVDLHKGHYIYVGSAFGPGGVRARVKRHSRTTKTCHWHIDYLTKHLSLVEAWYTHDTTKREHGWAMAISSMRIASGVTGFGSSDCKCHSHLFHTDSQPKISKFRQTIDQELVGHDEIHRWTH